MRFCRSVSTSASAILQSLKLAVARLGPGGEIFLRVTSTLFQLDELLRQMDEILWRRRIR